MARTARSSPIAILLLAAACATAPVEPATAPPRRATTPAGRRALIGKIERGLATWYGARFQGRRTASGETFDQHKLTAAHRNLPFGSRVRVTNLNNDLSVVVRINDRGPFSQGRIIDLSRAAADKIDMIDAGVVPCTVEVLSVPRRRR